MTEDRRAIERITVDDGATNAALDTAMERIRGLEAKVELLTYPMKDEISKDVELVETFPDEPVEPIPCNLPFERLPRNAHDPGIIMKLVD